MENCYQKYDLEERLEEYRNLVADHVASTGAKGKKLRDWSTLLWEEIFQGIPVDYEPAYPHMYPVLTAKEIMRVRKCHFCAKKLTDVYLRAMYSEEDFLYVCKPCKQELPLKATHFQIQYYNRRNPEVVNAKRYKTPLDVAAKTIEHKPAEEGNCTSKFSTLDKDQIASVQVCQVCQGQLDGVFVRCIIHKGWTSCLHIDCLDNFVDRASIEEIQFYEQGCLSRVQAWEPVDKSLSIDDKHELVLNSRSILLDRKCDCCGKKLDTTFTRCLYRNGAFDFSCKKCLCVLAPDIQELQHYERGISYGKLVEIETFGDEKQSSHKPVAMEAFDEEEDMPALVDSDCDCDEESPVSEKEESSYNKQKEWASICESMAIAKKWSTGKKSLDQAIKEVKQDLNREKDELRKKKLACVSLTLAQKEPVKLTPVSQHQVVVVNQEDNKSANSVQHNCQVCSISINTDYVRVRPCKGGDLFCHDKCWPSLQSRKNDFQRIYRYSAQGKLLEKVAVSKTEISVPVTKPALPTLNPAPVLPVKVEKVEPVEYKPSWREVDVSDYQELKKEKVKVKNNEKKRQKRAQKASKYLDLGGVNAHPAPARVDKWKVEAKQNISTIKDISSQQDGTEVWNSIFQSDGGMQLTLPVAEKPSPIEKAVMQISENAAIKSSPPAFDARCNTQSVTLSAQAKEFVPTHYVPPPFLPNCTVCHVIPATVINIPCRHVTSCINCFPYTTYCTICNSPCWK